jgi:Flp pilus assembly protein TadD
MRYLFLELSRATIPVLAATLLTACAQTPPAATASTPRQLASQSATALNAKDYTKAQALAKKATDIDPKFAEAWVGYGMASVRLGQADQARTAYERALSLHQARHLQNPSDANQVVQQIFLLTLLGRSADAEALLKQAHTDYPTDQTIAKLAGDFTATKQGWQSWTVEAKP